MEGTQNQHAYAKRLFREDYKFESKQRDIIHNAKCAVALYEKKISKAEWNVRKTTRDVLKLQEHLLSLEEDIKDYSCKLAESREFLITTLPVTENDV